ACSVSAVEELTGVRLDHFIEVDFDGFATIVDALDGIPVDLDEPLHDDKAQLDLPAGEQVLDGTDALALARTRHAVGDGSDISRMDNQQMVMEAIIDRAKSTRTLTRPDRLYGFLDAVTSSLRVDEDLDSVSALASLASTASSVPEDEITFEIMPWAPAPENPNRVVIAPEAEDVFTAIIDDEPIAALVRALVQLALLALILQRALSAWWSLAAFIGLMLTTASLTSLRRARDLPRGPVGAVVGVIVGALVTLALVLALGLVDREFEP